MNAVVEMKAAAGGVLVQQQGRMAISEIIGHVAMVQEVMRAVMKGPSKEHPQGVHYGFIPGTDKPTLYKQGAEVLCMAFRIAPSYVVEDLSTADCIRYRVTCTGTHQATGIVLGSGMGEGQSSEEKYKWRKAICKEEWDETPPHLRRTKHARGKGGTTYKQDQVRTEPADLANTVLKMASKRAHMAMTLSVTAASDCFAQDLDDMDDALRDHLTRHGDEGEGATTKEKPALPTYTDEEFSKNLVTWRKVIESGKKSIAEVLATIATIATLTEEQTEIIKATVAPTKEGAPDANA